MNARMKLQAAVASRTTEELVLLFEHSDSQMAAHPKETPVVREFLMDELERRNPEAFIDWMDANTNSPRQFFI